MPGVPRAATPTTTACSTSARRGCTRATGKAVPGAYLNVATVIGRLAATGQEGRDTDVAHSYGPVSVLRIEKYVNAADPAHPTAIERADAAPGRDAV